MRAHIPDTGLHREENYESNNYVPKEFCKTVTLEETLAGQVAVITGASSGIGRAIAVALSRRGVHLCLVGRDPVALAATLACIEQNVAAKAFKIDLLEEAEYQVLTRYLDEDVKRVDILIHSAGVIHQSDLEHSRIEDFDAQYATNLRAPYLLTQHLLPWLTRSRGQIVFINSSAGVSAKRPDIGQYAATKHGLKAVADSLREEVNPKGIRVLTVFLGRTATPMQAKLYDIDRRMYQPEQLLQPEDVASMVVHCLALPRAAEITDVSMRPMAKTT